MASDRISSGSVTDFYDGAAGDESLGNMVWFLMGIARSGGFR